MKAILTRLIFLLLLLLQCNVQGMERSPSEEIPGQQALREFLLMPFPESDKEDSSAAAAAAAAPQPPQLSPQALRAQQEQMLQELKRVQSLRPPRPPAPLARLAAKKPGATQSCGALPTAEPAPATPHPELDLAMPIPPTPTRSRRATLAIEFPARIITAPSTFQPSPPLKLTQEEQALLGLTMLIETNQPISRSTVKRLRSLNQQHPITGDTALIVVVRQLCILEAACRTAASSLNLLLNATKGRINLDQPNRAGETALSLLRRNGSPRIRALVQVLEQEQVLRIGIEQEKEHGRSLKTEKQESEASVKQGGKELKEQRQKVLRVVKKIRDGVPWDGRDSSDSD